MKGEAQLKTERNTSMSNVKDKEEDEKVEESVQLKPLSVQEMLRLYKEKKGLVNNS
jgi:hypothetical protein